MTNKHCKKICPISKYLISLFFIQLSVSLNAQYGFIYGTVTDYEQNPASYINVSLKGRTIGTSADEQGAYKLAIPGDNFITVTFSGIGYLNLDTLVQVKKNQKLRLDIVLQIANEQIQVVQVEDKKVRQSTLTRLNPKFTAIMPNSLGGIEAMIKTMPGVSSNNELSSQYSVRGGNFDENLVYVDGIEIYRPILVRSGQQEGMSFINPDMVSSVLFSAGGFDTKYGDKMSSVLDVRYKQVKSFGGSFSASLLGGAASIHGDSKGHRFKYIAGIRYKTTKYLLKSLKTTGDYDPRFVDFQVLLNYQLTEKWQIKFLGNYANTHYTFVPKDRKTKFGTYNEAYQLNMYFDGNEKDKFSNYTSALELNYKNNDLDLRLIASSFQTNEQETFDIQSQYWINQIDRQFGSQSFGDSIASIGVGSYLKHARNFLNAQVYKIEHKGIYTHKNNNLYWGLSSYYQIVNDRLTEWKMVDSAGFSLPYTDSVVSVDFYTKSKNKFSNIRLSAFLQDTYMLNTKSGEWNFTIGLRTTYSAFNRESLFSPRFNIAFQPNWKNDFLFRFAAGYYYQPPFYKEIRRPDSIGSINYDIKSQQSIHFVLAGDYNFKMAHRPFKLVAEAYYKKLDRLISYNVDNLRLIYSAKNDAQGYALGLDIKLNGELVKGVDSWISLSFLRTMEKIDQHKEPIFFVNKNGIKKIKEYKDAGYIPRLTDQLFNLNIYFQDYLPGNPDYKVHLQISYATGLPYSTSNKFYQRKVLRMPSYKRVDIGFSKVLKSEAKIFPKGHFLHHIKDAWVSLEVLNLLNNYNAVSMEWVQDYAGNGYAVQNTLTGRRFNLKLLVRF